MFFLQKYKHMTDVLSTGRAGEFSAGGALPLGAWACSAALDRRLWGPECGYEALTSLPGEGGNLHLKAFHPHLFCFHSLSCSVWK